MHPMIEEFLKKAEEKEAIAQQQAQEQADQAYQAFKRRVLNNLGLYEKVYGPSTMGYPTDEYPISEWDENAGTSRYYKKSFPEITDEELSRLLPYSDMTEPEDCDETESDSRNIPETVNDVLKPNKTSVALLRWARWIEGFGAFMLAMLIIAGLIISILAAGSVKEDDAFVTFLTTALSWALYTAIEYAAYRLVSLLFTALANLVRNTQISADLALMEANQDH